VQSQAQEKSEVGQASSIGYVIAFAGLILNPFLLAGGQIIMRQMKEIN
jgi:uncharacterized sodium:solute symporter family permease YidK